MILPCGKRLIARDFGCFRSEITFGFISKSKKKLLKEVTVFLNTVEVIDVK